MTCSGPTPTRQHLLAGRVDALDKTGVTHCSAFILRGSECLGVYGGVAVELIAEIVLPVDLRVGIGLGAANGEARTRLWLWIRVHMRGIANLLHASLVLMP